MQMPSYVTLSRIMMHIYNMYTKLFQMMSDVLHHFHNLSLTLIHVSFSLLRLDFLF